MGRRLDLQHLSEEECEKILNVIQRDFNIRQGEKERLKVSNTFLGHPDSLATSMFTLAIFSWLLREGLQDDAENKIEETIIKEKKTGEILAEKETFNENCCMRCCETFSFIFNRKRVCINCKYNVCKNCCVYDDTIKDYVCSTCQKHRDLTTKSCEWFYHDVKRRFRRFGSAKVVRSLFKRRESESEDDSGYDPSLYSSMSTNVKKRPSVQGLFESFKNLYTATGRQDDEESDSGLGAQKPQLESDTVDGTVEGGQKVHLERYEKQLISIKEKVYNMLRKRFADDHLKLKGMRPNHGLLQSYRKEISIDLTNLAQALYLAYENHPTDDHKEINKLVQETLVKQVEAFVGNPVSVTLPVDEKDDDSSATDDEDSLCDDHPFEDQLADHLIAQILESFRSCEDNLIAPSIKNRPATIKEGSHESLDNLNRTIEYENDDASRNSIHRSDSNRVNPLMSPRHSTQFLSIGSPLPSFNDVGSPLGKREIDPDDLAAIEQNSDDFENIPDYDDDDDINYLEGQNLVPDGNNWTFSLKDETGDVVENMEYQEWVKNIRRPSSGSFSTKPIKNIVNTTQEFGRVSPMIGNRKRRGSVEVDDLTDSSICSDDSDGEVEEFPHLGDISMESREIAEITKHMSPILTGPPEIIAQPDVPKTEEAIEVCTDPRFEMKPMDLAVPEGEHAQLRCRLSGTDPIDVFWYRENKKEIDQLEDDDKYEMGRAANQYTLTIYNTIMKDVGGYICIAVNGEGQCSCTTKLTLKENPIEKKPPQFLKQLEDVEVIEGQGVKFMIKVKGYPVPRVSWFRDGRRIKSNDEYQLQKFGNRGYLLTIDNITLDNDAEYSVIAQNCLGRIKCDAQLLVEPKPKALSTSQLNLPLKRSHPKDKSLTHLENLSQKVAMTRRTVSGTAEDVLSSAQKMSSLDDDLENMDRRLNNLEAEVTKTIEMDDIELSQSFRQNQEAILGEYNAEKKAAGDIRLVTSTALSCLTRAERIIATQREPQRSEVKRKSITREPEIFKFPSRIQNMNDLDKTDDDDANDSFKPVLDFSPPRVDSRRYSREYVVGGEAATNQRKWDVLPPSDHRRSETRQVALADAEDERLHKRLDVLLEKCDTKIACGKNIYMAAGRVFSLEEKIQMLETKVNLIDESTEDADMFMMEDEVASAVAGVTRSERQVDNVEQQVGELKKMFSSESLQSQMSTQSEPDSLVDSGCGTGATTPTDLMSPRPSDIYQIEEDIVELPSVRGLMTMFNSSAQVADSGTPVVRVHSLTGRDVPSSVRDKYRNKSPSGNDKPQSSVKKTSSFSGKHQRPMSPLAVRQSSDTTPKVEAVSEGGARPRTLNTQTPNSFNPQARSSPVPQIRGLSNKSYTSKDTKLSNTQAMPKMKELLVNPNRTFDSLGHEIPQNQPKIKQPLVNPHRSFDSYGHQVSQKQLKLKPQLVNPNRSYDSSCDDVTSTPIQPIKATESFSTHGSASRVRTLGSVSGVWTSSPGKDSSVKHVRKTDSRPSSCDSTPKLRSPSSSKSIMSKAAFWDNRIIDNVSSDQGVAMDEVFKTDTS